MVRKLYLVLFIVFFQVNCLKVEENTTSYELVEEMKKRLYIINSNATYKFINSNEKLIYVLEVRDDIEIKDEKNQTFKYLTSLSKLNDSIIINQKDEIGTEIKVYITSISNNEVDTSQIKGSNFHYSGLIFKNIIHIFHVKENENQIINLNSNENSVLFYYYKYEFNNDVSARDYYPINRELFKRYDGSLLTLEKNSIYIIIAYIYKLDNPVNSIEIYVSPLQVDKNIELEYDFVYFKASDDIYNITFLATNLTRIFKLSKKTNESIISLNGAIILNSTNPYYELTEEQMSNGIQLKVEKADGLIEILFSSKNDSDILDFDSIENHRITKKYTIIKIPKNKYPYFFHISSKNKNKLKNFNFGFMYKITKKDYFYNWLNVNQPYNDDGFDIRWDIPYLYHTETEKDEYQIFELVLDKEQIDNDIYLDYNPTYFSQHLKKQIDEKRAEYIIGNITSILNKFYIYKDIAKIPPKIKNLDNYHHQPIDLIESLRKISIKNRTHFGLYQDIHQTLSSVRDDHLDIRINKIDNITELPSWGFCSPFKLYIDNNEGVVSVKMKSNDFCLELFRNKDKIYKYLEDHANISLKYINRTDPFDFIQNFGKYQRVKNVHAQFTLNLERVSSSRFDIEPYDIPELYNIEYEFENGDIINNNYLLVTFNSFTDLNQKEFEEFFLSLNYNQSNPLLTPDLFQTKKLFMKHKGLLFDETPNSINWDLQTEDGKLKCKVDHNNKYNVFLQTSFSFSSFDDAVNVMVNCSELFYSNNYSIIGIENKNGGGNALLYEIWHQLIQQKTLDKSYLSLIRNNYSTDYFKNANFYSSYSNIETCKIFGSFEEMGEKTDNYGKSQEFEGEIKHNRTGIYDFLDKNWRKRLDKIRKKNFENKNLKNPTDILIYTDSYCFSACSGFIKAFQNTGGAIIVGFNGNPKIEGVDKFDGSQSSSSVNAFKSEEYNELEKLGYHVYGITYSESFDDSYKNNKTFPIPREYSVDLVDRRIPIYEQYSDDLYETFISNAGIIFEEFKNKCNKNNKKLILNDESCELKEYEKGGHPCKDDGTWDMNNCSAYYCDLGFYYDQFLQKCVLDVCTNITNEINIEVNDNTYMETKEFDIEPNSEMVFHLGNDSYYYFFQSNVTKIFSDYDDRGNILNGTNIYIISYKPRNVFNYEVNVNYFKTIKEPTKIKLTTIEKDPLIEIQSNVYANSLSASTYKTINGKYQIIYILQSDNKHIIYIPTFDKDMKAYYSEYNFDITPQEILDVDTNKLKEFSNKLFYMKESKAYIIILKYPQDVLSNPILFLSKYEIDQDISINSNIFCFLSKQNYDYNLYNPNSKNFYIKLSSQTPDAEIQILDNNVTLNKNNKYFLLDKNIQKISLKLKNENPALIEILYELFDTQILDSDKKEFPLVNGEYYMLKYKTSDNIESIQVNLESNNTTFLAAIYANIGKENYAGPFPPQLNFSSKMSSMFLVPNEQLSDDETFNILIRTKNNVTLTVQLNKTKEGGEKETDGKEQDGEGLPTWALILIIVGGVIILALIIFIIIICVKKDNVDADAIEKGKLLSSYEELK